MIYKIRSISRKIGLIHLYKAEIIDNTFSSLRNMISMTNRKHSCRSPGFLKYISGFSCDYEFTHQTIWHSHKFHSVLRETSEKDFVGKLKLSDVVFLSYNISFWKNRTNASGSHHLFTNWAFIQNPTIGCVTNISLLQWKWWYSSSKRVHLLKIAIVSSQLHKS